MGINDQRKLESLILHFANNIPVHLGVKKLAKLMYFVDFTTYELKEKSVTKESYKKYRYGPMPVRFYTILEEMEKKGLLKYQKQKIEYFPASIKPLKKANYSVFDKQEIEVIELVTQRFKNSNAKEIEDVAQNEPPYKMVEFDEEIPYHLAFYRNSFGEMELNEDVDSQRRIEKRH